MGARWEQEGTWMIGVFFAFSLGCQQVKCWVPGGILAAAATHGTGVRPPPVNQEPCRRLWLVGLFVANLIWMMIFDHALKHGQQSRMIFSWYALVFVALVPYWVHGIVVSTKCIWRKKHNKPNQLIHVERFQLLMTSFGSKPTWALRLF